MLYSTRISNLNVKWSIFSIFILFQSTLAKKKRRVEDEIVEIINMLYFVLITIFQSSCRSYVKEQTNLEFQLARMVG